MGCRMNKIIINGVVYGTGVDDVTMEEYMALSESEKNDGTVWLINDTSVEPDTGN